MNSNSLSSRLQTVESLRGLAALMIITYHMVMLSKNISLPSYLDVIKERFALGVPLFYALSGFVLAYGYLEKLNNREQIIKFYIRRYFLIAPLFYFMLIVRVLYVKIKYGIWQYSIPDLLINLSLLFGLLPGKHESMTWAGWSIGVEILFYIIFPIIAVAVTNVRTGITAFFVALFISSTFFTGSASLNIGSYGYMSIITHFPTFLSGILAFLFWKRIGFIASFKWGFALLALMLMLAVAVTLYPASYQKFIIKTGYRLDLYIWSVLFMLLILSLCLWPSRLFVNRISTSFGKISFSLYLWHPLVIILLSNTYGDIGKLYGSGLANFLLCFFLTLSCIVLIAFVSFFAIELPGMNIGKKLANSYSASKP